MLTPPAAAHPSSPMLYSPTYGCQPVMGVWSGAVAFPLVGDVQVVQGLISSALSQARHKPLHVIAFCCLLTPAGTHLPLPAPDRPITWTTAAACQWCSAAAACSVQVHHPGAGGDPLAVQSLIDNKPAPPPRPPAPVRPVLAAPNDTRAIPRFVVNYITVCIPTSPGSCSGQSGRTKGGVSRAVGWAGSKEAAG
ncbi:hypothetical protein HaLaN_13321 [Haematococcus lacustris]|uniref:Uncharacterized protein n=1 Tax=Haematococcus lacustris TaxID=44745 RepID=A0A699ZM12_HAELA|nr:hypothetical protein HaLaN_13321 [Haematococcus lacustris]